MLVKFHLNDGSTAELVARDNKGRESRDIGHAVRAFKSLYGDVPFTLDAEYQMMRERHLMAPLSPAREAAIRQQFPNLFPA